MKNLFFIILLLISLVKQNAFAQAYQKANTYQYESYNNDRKASIPIKVGAEILLNELRVIDSQKQVVSQRLKVIKASMAQLPEIDENTKLVYHEKTIQLAEIEAQKDLLLDSLGNAASFETFCLGFWNARTFRYSELFHPDMRHYQEDWQNKSQKVRNHYLWRTINRGDIKLINNLGFQVLGDRGAVYSEVVSDVFNTMQPIRVSLDAALVATTDDATGEKQAVQKLLANGGNIALNFSTPLLYAKSDRLALYADAQLRGVGDFPVAGSITDTIAVNGSFSINVYGEVSTLKKLFSFYTHLKTGVYAGSDIFYENLDIKQKPFLISQLAVGVSVAQSVKLFTNIPFGYGKTFNAKQMPFTIGIQFIR